MIEFEGSGQEHYLIFFRSNKFNVLKALEQLKGYLRMKQAEPSWYTGLGDVDNLGHALELVRVCLFICPFFFESPAVYWTVFWTFRKKNSRPKKLKPKKTLTNISKNSSKLFKNSIICQLKTNFLLKKVLKLIYFVQKFAQTYVFFY